MHFELTDAQREVQQRARAFARQEVAPQARRADESGEFPVHLVARMAELGFLAGPIPVRYGGAGMDYLSYTLISEELGWADASVRGFLAVHGSLVALCVHDWGSEDQKRRYLPGLASGERIGCYCLTEPEAGSDAAGIQTRASPAATGRARNAHSHAEMGQTGGGASAEADEQAGGYLLNGEKIWITNGGIADLAIVFASLDPERRHRGICAFLVDATQAGFRREPMPGSELGHRAADHARISLEDVWAPRSAILGEPGEGFTVAMSALDHGRLGVAAGAVGLAQACLDACLDFVRTRRQFGKRIGDFQMIQSAIADMTAEIEAARLLVYRAAWMKQQGLPTRRETAIAKLFATEMAVRAASQAVLIHGGRGYSSEYPVERHYRDIKGLQIYEGTSHIQRLVIAREQIGPDQDG